MLARLAQRAASLRKTLTLPSRTISIRAAVAHAPDQPYQVEQVSLREPGPNELLVSVTATGICHTDVVVKKLGLCAFPIVLGHEGVGRVQALGSALEGRSDLAVGDRVVMTYAACGSCAACGVGKPSYCDHHGELNFAGTRPDGSTTHAAEADQSPVFGSFFQQSSFASHALVTEQNVVKVPDSVAMDDTLLAPLGCGIQTGAGAVMNTVQARAGESIAVFGCGAVGLSAVMAARVVGCTNIIAVDVNESRLELARELGATSALSAIPKGEDSLVEQIKSLTNGAGVHYSIDTSGNTKALRDAFDACRPMGVCGMIAPGPPGTEVAIDTMSLLPGKSLRGVVQGDSVSKNFIPALIDLHLQGQFPYDRLIRVYENGLDDINQAIADTEAGTVIKPVIRMS